MTNPARPAAMDALLESVVSGLADCDPLPPHDSIALDVLTDMLQDDEVPSPASAFTAAKYVLAQHARELAQLLVDCKAPANVDPRHWAAYQLKRYATRLDGGEATR